MTSPGVWYDEVAKFADAEDGPPPTDPALNADLVKLRLISEARGRGASWSTIGSMLGVDGKTAKVLSKRLARKAQTAVLRDRAT